MLRRAFLSASLAALAAPAFAESPGFDEPPAPFAQSRAAVRYWPVITTHPQALEISNATTSRPLRRFNAPRPAAQADNPTRRHVGVDLFANPGDTVIAVEDGRLLATYPFLRAATGEMSWCLIIAHDGYVATYGEIREDALSANHLALGDLIHAGQRIATISDTAQLHFETSIAGSRRNSSWRHGAPRPAQVLDPTQLLLDLATHGIRIRPGDPLPG